MPLEEKMKRNRYEYHAPHDLNRRNKRSSGGRKRKGLVTGLSALTITLLLGYGVKTQYIDRMNEAALPETVVVQDAVMEEKAREFRLTGGSATINYLTTLPKRISLDFQKKGENHSVRASRYAYDTQEVKDWIKGRKPYEGKKIVFLTFDDGPVQGTYKVLDILKRRGVPGTFFIPGKTLETQKDKEVLKRYIQEGHAIGIHSYSHDYSYLYPDKVANPERIVSEYQAAIDLMRVTLGKDFDSKVFRFPGGAGSWKNIPAAQDALRVMGAADIDWNSISGDSEPARRRPDGPPAMAEHVMNTLNDQAVKDVAVVLMHDSKEVTSLYLDQVIDRFIEEGYSFGILK